MANGRPSLSLFRLPVIGVHRASFRRHLISGVIAVLSLAGLQYPSLGADHAYPEMPVRIIVPVSAGSSGDLRVRFLAEKLSARLGQRFVVENKPGAGTTLGAALVARAKPDGYTLLITFTPSFTVGPSIYKNAGYDPKKSFTPIATIGRASPIFAVHPSIPAHTIKDFVSLSRARPQALTIGHSGIGAGLHLPTELFRRAASIEFTYVSYKSEAMAFPDLVGGQISAMFVYTAGGVPLITSGKIRALAVAAAERNGALPNVPTFAEAGYPTVKFYVHGLLLGPAGLPKEVVRLLHGEITFIMQDPDVVRSYETTGAEIMSGTPEQTAALIHDELATSGAIVRALGVSLD